MRYNISVHKMNQSQTSPAPPKRRQRREGLIEEKSEALAHLLASEARQLPQVRRFRAESLPDGPVENESVGAWLRAHKGSAAVEPGETLATFGLRTIAYADMKARKVRHVPAIGEPLEALLGVTDLLAKLYRWREWEAVHFVLCDAVPAYRPVSASVKLSGPFPGLSTISLAVDLSLNPQDVAREFARLRAQVLGPSARVRSIGLRAYALVRCWSDADWDAAAAVANWNRERPEDQIRTAEQRKLFKRDAHAARERLLNGSVDVVRLLTPARRQPVPEPEDWDALAARLSARHRRKMAWEE